VAGVAFLNVLFVAFDPHVTRAVPLLLLLVPVTVSSVLGGVRASVPLALLTAGVYSFHFVEPIGAIRFGFTEDTATMITFVCVAIFVSVAVQRGDEGMDDRERQRAVLLRSVSHDLRNPLGTIRAASADLRDDVISDPVQRTELLSLMVDESDRLDRIVRNLLSMSRIEAGALSPELAPERLADIVDQCVHRLDRGPAHRLVVDIPTDIPDVWVDRTQIDQVITNLVENSLRHGPAGTEVRISAELSPPGMVTVTVSDRGPGFGPAKDSAFEAFRPSGGAGGEGVGLAVCKAVVEAHAGSITASDAPGGGARVSFSVPAAR
jgi:K+-sensing histidine kinase KdpD